MSQIKESLKTCILELLKEKYPVEETPLEISTAPQISMGDYATAFPFSMAKVLKRSPREIAEEIRPLLESLPGIEKVEVAGGGFINLFLKRGDFFRRFLDTVEESSLDPEETKIIIEHTNINPNKAAHIGHLRNAILGDTLSRCLKYKGERVEVQNYIDDTGIQVVDIVFGFMKMEQKVAAEIETIEDPFDYYCWDLYTRVSAFLEENADAQKIRSRILKNIEQGEPPEAALAHIISRRILRAHLRTMRRLDISYDVLPCESSILHLKFWERAFHLLKQKHAISFAESGENKGCWVMSLEDSQDQVKIIVRSDGTVTYVGKDIAYQLWKFGLLDQDFFYKPFEEINDHTIWITSDHPSSFNPDFGKASLVYNVIDTRQAYLQKVVAQGLRSLQYNREADHSIHFSYEMVALSPKSLTELGLKAAEGNQEKAFHEVSGRKGLGVKADDLIDRLQEKALTEVAQRNPDFSEERKRDTAHKIACGALRYFMLKFSRNSLIVFDFEEALSFEGETGPYLQYTLVRIRSIFKKLKAMEGTELSDIKRRAENEIPLDALSESEMSDFWDLIFYGSQCDDEVLHSLRSLEFSHLAKFAFNLCQKFNAYYHKYPILFEKNRKIRDIRLLTLVYIERTLSKALSLMGIPRPHRM